MLYLQICYLVNDIKRQLFLNVSSSCDSDMEDPNLKEVPSRAEWDAKPASEESGSTSVQGRRLFKFSRALDLHKFRISNARKNARCLIHVMQLNEMQRISLSFPLVNFLLQLKSRVLEYIVWIASTSQTKT